jgi:arylsulfatase A-like enzyme
MKRLLILALGLASFGVPPAALAAARPNLIWIMADDLGYGELGCYGQKVIATPHLDRMAGEGLRFTQFYAGATVCAPSRSVLMTGQHHGHTPVRGNAGTNNPAAQALKAGDLTVANVLQQAGYRTALIGKWGLGDVGAAESGLPRKHGFDYFYGYLSQHHAHNHFPDFLWRNETKEALPNVVVPIGGNGGGYATTAVRFADDLFAEECLQFVSENKDRPFFLYWSLVIPHANNERARALGDGAEVPDYGPYADQPWPNQDKGQAAMITRMDGYVGRMLERLTTLGIASNTLVIFTSDNGPHNESKHDLARFNPSGPFTGIKRSLTDGGIRVPCIAWWPGQVKPRRESGHVAYFGDWLATAAELAGAQTPEPADSLSFVPTLLGNSGAQKPHEFLYWEFHEGGFEQAALYQGRWKGLRAGGPDAPIQLFDQEQDAAEKTDVAARRPDLAEKISAYLKTARTALPAWEPKWQAKKPAKAAKAAQRPPKPNIVLILADDLGYTDVACFGSRYYETPHLDRLAAQGMKLTSGYTCGPNCQPTRAALMSGQYGPRTGVYTVGSIDRFDWPSRPLRPVDNVTKLPLDKITIAQALQKAGYTTGIFGKWHLGEDPAHHPARRGFDEAIVSMGRHFDFATNPRVSYPEGAYLADFLTGKAEEFIRRHKDGPFFVFLSHFAVHAPHEAKTNWSRHFETKAPAGSHHDPTYAGMIASVDESVGRMVALLDELKLSENTLLIFSSDNGGVGGYAREGIRGGDITDNAPLKGGKGMLYEGGIRVPYLVRWPGKIAPGTVCDQPINTVDLYPTLLDLAATKPLPGYPLDGTSYLGLLTGAASSARHPLYWHFPGYLGAGRGTWRTSPAGAIREGDWKLLEFFETGKLELYNLREDLGEQHNLAAKLPAKVEELRTRLHTWRKEVGAQMPSRNPAYNPSQPEHNPAANKKNVPNK